jgi:hypothetical protein
MISRAPASASSRPSATIFGTAAALSVAFAARWLHGWPRRKVWAIAQGVMALGTVLPLLHQALWALAALLAAGLQAPWCLSCRRLAVPG